MTYTIYWRHFLPKVKLKKMSNTEPTNENRGWTQVLANDIRLKPVNK